MCLKIQQAFSYQNVPRKMSPKSMSLTKYLIEAVCCCCLVVSLFPRMLALGTKGFMLDSHCVVPPIDAFCCLQYKSQQESSVEL